MRAAVAGTFNVLHDGHKALIDRALELGDDVFIGITTDEMASGSRTFLNPYYIRSKAVREYVGSKGRECNIFEISDMYGPESLMNNIDVLVVSEETFENGKKVVQRFGGKMQLSVVDIVKKTDGTKISSTDIVKGLCSKDGDMSSMDVAVGSLNPVKIEAVREVMEKIYGNVRIFAVDVKSGVPEQPFGDETKQGAVNRAKGALGSHKLGVGIEAGVFEMYDSLYDVQHCAIIDQEGRITLGMGSGFRYPDKVIEKVRGGKTVGESMKEVYKESVGKTYGAIGLLSKGLLDRKELTKQSVIAAMVPRLWDE